MAKRKQTDTEEPSWKQKNRENMMRKSREKAESIRNIGPIPVIENIERRQSCERGLAKFIMTYAGQGLAPFSADHLAIIDGVERSVFSGGRFVEAVYRGFGKSTLSRAAAVWAVLYGHKKFMPIISANAPMAGKNLDAIKIILLSPEILADFPDVAAPLVKLEGVAQRANAQLYMDRNGEPQQTFLTWKGNAIVLPFTDGAYDANGEWHDNRASGAVIMSCGLLSSSARGLNFRRRDGVSLRPDIAIIDDPQTDDSAKNPVQVDRRMGVIKNAIIRSADHASSLSVIMPCTVIQKNDLVDQLLDNVKNPAWVGHRIPYFRKFSDRHDDLWLGKYKELRQSYVSGNVEDFERARNEANAFYAANRAEMDAGCIVSWEYPGDKSQGEISAIQHGYNALIDDGPESFWSEFQNQPLADDDSPGQLTESEVLATIKAPIPRFELPHRVEKLTCFIDVQKDCLFYMVAGFEDSFSTHVIDYGVYPKQPTSTVSVKSIVVKLSHKHTAGSQEGLWRAGFEALTEILCSREYKRTDGMVMKLSRVLIDANDGNAMKTVFDFARQSKFAGVIMPARGKAIGAAGVPFVEYKRKPGEKIGNNWVLPSPIGRASNTRYIRCDTNAWKSFARLRLQTAAGDPGDVNIFGRELNGNPASHSMLIDHLLSEYSVTTEGRGRKVDEWFLRPNRENHLFDCFVGCCLAASEQGIEFGRAAVTKKTILAQAVDRRERLARLGRKI